MEVRIENGKLHIIADVINPPMPSASGKTMVVASSRGNQTTTATVLQWGHRFSSVEGAPSPSPVVAGVWAGVFERRCFSRPFALPWSHFTL